ncbi:hypothetical protein [Pedobacter sp. Hv1]|uniref:hypothetical protein n=1 Tax=Pedobacter sp. Hv1 TaxID=1740090 RepID=UPI0006D8BE77|nr:hypothetical protein [Pedobacter sp. Hv1]KQB99386.1 hypothetical protein AQF98_17590 [Pedobacter sp. Hv1]
MNNTFNIQRFGLLLRRQWLEFGKIYLITLLVALGVIVAFYGITLWPYLTEVATFAPRELNFREPLFLIFGPLFITVIASNYFAHLGQKPKAIIDLMIPASTFEKFLGSLLFTGILATASFTLLFYLTDLAFMAKIRGIYFHTATASLTTAAESAGAYDDNVDYFFSKHEIFTPLYVAPFFITSIFLLGSIYFEKFHYIKTTIAVMIFSGIWAAIIAKAGKILFEGKVPVGENSMRQMNERSTAEIWITVLLLFLTFVFWAITYVRLKEKQV